MTVRPVVWIIHQHQVSHRRAQRQGLGNQWQAFPVDHDDRQLRIVDHLGCPRRIIRGMNADTDTAGQCTRKIRNDGFVAIGPANTNKGIAGGEATQGVRKRRG
jgi:hypothetical protein